MGRKVEDKDGLKKGAWTADEDQKLLDYIQKHGPRKWRTVPLNAGLKRCEKSCRLRWTNYLRPDIKRGSFSFEEEEAIIQLHSILGNKWSTIATYLPGRTDNEIKNYWHTRIKKRLFKMGIDPVTHGPRIINVQELYSFLKLLHLLNIQNLLQIGSDMNTNLLNLTSQILHDNQLINPHAIQNRNETSQFNNLLNSTTSNMPALTDNPVLTQTEMAEFSPSLSNSTSSKNTLPISYCNNNGDFSTSHFEQIFASTPDLGRFGFGSLTSTPSSSSAYINGGAEDEMKAFCIPYGLDDDGFM